MVLSLAGEPMIGGTHPDRFVVSLTDSDIPLAGPGLIWRRLFDGFRLCGARRLDSLRETGGYDLVKEVWVLQTPAASPSPCRNIC